MRRLCCFINSVISTAFQAYDMTLVSNALLFVRSNEGSLNYSRDCGLRLTPYRSKL